MDPSPRRKSFNFLLASLSQSHMLWCLSCRGSANVQPGAQPGGGFDELEPGRGSEPGERDHQAPPGFGADSSEHKGHKNRVNQVSDVCAALHTNRFFLFVRLWHPLPN